LAEIVEKKGPGKWEEIAAELGTNRTIAQCFSKYMAHKNNTLSKRKFTKEEDKRLVDAVKLFGNWNWQQVASVMDNRTGQQCLHRWSKSLDPAIKRTPWTQQEDQILTNTVKIYGAGNWRKIQRFVKGRTDVQCRERWMNILHPSLNRTKLTDEVCCVDQHDESTNTFT
jgi:myb proto-oncogene protein